MTEQELDAMLADSRSLLETQGEQIKLIAQGSASLELRQLTVLMGSLQTTLVGIHSELAFAREQRRRDAGPRFGE